MHFDLSRRFWALFLPAWLCGLAPVWGAESAVRDDAHFFSPQAVEHATQVLRDIKQRQSKDVVIETYASVPENLQSKFNSMDKARFYREWSRDQAKELGVNGVYIQLLRSPSHLEWEANAATRQRTFTQSDGDRMTAMMVDRLKAKDYDRALLDGVDFIQTRMSENTRSIPPVGGTSGNTNPLPGPMGNRLPPANTSPPINRPSQPPNVTLPSTGLCAGIGKWICLGVALLLFMKIRGAMRRARSGGYNSGPMGGGGVPPTGGGPFGGGMGGDGGFGRGGGGGGGFGKGIFGGILGGMLGNWIGGRMSDNRTYGDTNPMGGGPFDNPGSGNFGGSSGSDSGSDYSGGGADFGGGGSDLGGGGDFGGGSDSGGSAGGGSDF